MDEKILARVFISCGQQEGEERDFANKLQEMLQSDEYKFDPYVAIAQQSVWGLRENIFRQLEESEYFIFIDFKRERLYRNGKDTGKHRGSLWANQELAIASFLELDNVLIFQEEGIKDRNGIIGAIQGNATGFSNKEELIDLIKKEIAERNWKSFWRNELLLSRSNDDIVDCLYGLNDKKIPSRFFHIKVENLHRSKIAQNCVVFIDSINNVSTGEELSHEIIEAKWKGVKRIDIHIPSKKDRKFDGFFVFKNDHFNNIAYLGYNRDDVDFSGYGLTMNLNIPNTYDISYHLCSDNFSQLKNTFRAELNENIEKIKFYKLE